MATVITTDHNNRLDLRNRLLNKIETALTSPALQPESDPIEIIKKHAKWVPARFAIEEGLLPDVKREIESYIPQGEVDTRASVKRSMLKKVENIDSQLVTETVPIEIVEKYANWTPARLSVGPEEELTPEFNSDKTIIFPREIEKRENIKLSLSDKIEKSLVSPTPKVVIESAPIEILPKYANWVPARIALEQEEEFSQDSIEEESFNPHSESEKREVVKRNLFNKVEEYLTDPQMDPEPLSVEIIEKYSSWTPARFSMGAEEVVSTVKKDETFIPQGEVDKRNDVKFNTLKKVAESLTLSTTEELSPVEIIEKYSTWTPARLDLELEEELLPEVREQDPFILTSEISKRGSIKSNLLNKVEDSLTPAQEDPEPPSVEILEKYTQGLPVGLSIEPMDALLPEFKREEFAIPRSEVSKRRGLKEGLLNKVETVLTPSIIVEPEPVEIIEKYVEGLPVRLSIEPMDELLPEFKREEFVMPYSELPKRSDLKGRLLDKVESARIPSPSVIEPEPIEIIEEYAQGIPVQLSIEPMDEFPEVKKEEFIVPRSELPKRYDLKEGLLNKVDNALVPPLPVIEPEPIDIIEGYAQGIPVQFTTEPMDEFPEFAQKDVTIPLGEMSTRHGYKEALLNKVESAIIPSAPVESAPIEILERYTQGLPLQLSIDPMDELLPEFKKEESFIPNREISKRYDLKEGLFNKVEESLTPPLPVIQDEPAPIEILKKYAKGLPVKLAIEPMDELLPEFKKEESFIPNREISKRHGLKEGLLNKVDSTVVPSLPVTEPEPIEIIERYAQGIPVRLSDDPMDESLEINDSTSFISDRDNLNRQDFKSKLLDKVTSLPVEASNAGPIEILGYSQRSINSLGPEFEEVKNLRPIISTEVSTKIVEQEPLSLVEEVPILRLPSNYQDMDEKTLYGILIRESELKHSSETANLTLDILGGRSNQVAEFQIINSTENSTILDSKQQITLQPIRIQDQYKVQDGEKRAVFASNLASKVNTLPIAPLTVETSNPVIFDLPEDWQNVPLSILRTELLSTGATPEQVDFKLASMVRLDPVDPALGGTEIPELTVDLPTEFDSWRSNEQYIYLTKDRKLPPGQANELIYNLSHLSKEEVTI